MTDDELLDEIQAIRAANNVNWVDLLRLAFEVAPERARVIVKRIDEADGELKELSRQLANNVTPNEKCRCGHYDVNHGTRCCYIMVGGLRGGGGATMCECKGFELTKGPAPSTKNCPDQRPGCHISDYHVH